IGSRVRLLGRDIQRHAARHYLGRVFATAVSLLLKLPVYDSQCGAKVFRTTDSIRNCFLQPFASRWLFDVELLGRVQAQANTRNRVREVPLMTWCDVGGSKLTLMTFLSAPFDLVRTSRAIQRWAQQAH